MAGVLTKLNAKRETPPVRIEAYKLTEEDEPDHEWVIPGLIERQGRILIVGAEGCGKSLLALTLAVQAAAGLPILDRFMPKIASRVVYMDLEMGRSSTRRRLRQLLISAKHKVAPGDLQMFLRPDGLDLSVPIDSIGVNSWFDKVEPELVIIDPLYKLMTTDSNYEREVKPTLKAIDQWRVIHGCAVILIHHLRKRPAEAQTRGRDKSDVFGSSVLLRWPETILMLNEDNVKVEKDRDSTFEGVRYFPVKRGGMWPMSLETPSLFPLEQIWEHIRTAGPCSSNSVSMALGGRKSDVLDGIRELEKLGRIVLTNKKWEVV